MGSPDSERQRGADEVSHEVTVSTAPLTVTEFGSAYTPRSIEVLQAHQKRGI